MDELIEEFDLLKNSMIKRLEKLGYKVIIEVVKEMETERRCQANKLYSDISTTARYTKALREGQRKLVNSFEVPEIESNIIELAG